MLYLVHRYFIDSGQQVPIHTNRLNGEVKQLNLQTKLTQMKKTNLIMAIPEHLLMLMGAPTPPELGCPQPWAGCAFSPRQEKGC